MKQISKLLSFVRPYWKYSIFSLILLVLVVFIDLAIPRLIQRIIDQGINQNSMKVVINTTIIMLSISVFQVLFALGEQLFFHSGRREPGTRYSRSALSQDSIIFVWQP